MYDQILALVRECWPEIRPDLPMPTHFDVVLQSKNRVILFLFDSARREATPLLVVKIDRRPSDLGTRKRYISRLVDVQARLEPDLAATLPRTVVLGQVCGQCCVAETILPGSPLKTPGPRTPEAHLHMEVSAVAAWLAALHEQTRIRMWPLDETTIEPALLGPLRPFCLSSPARALLADLAGAARERLYGRSLPVAWRYGDAHAGNFVLKDQRVSGAFDWTGGGPSEWPAIDWLYFAFYYAHDYCKQAAGRRHATIEDAQAALDLLLAPPTTAVADVLQDATAAYLIAQGLAEDLLPWLYAALLPTLAYNWDVPTLLLHVRLHLLQRLNLYDGSRSISQH
jgi:hypothetical protein